MANITLVFSRRRILRNIFGETRKSVLLNDNFTRNIDAAIKDIVINCPSPHERDELTESTLMRRSYTKLNYQEWLRQLLDSLSQEERRNIVIVCDNAPCHTNLEQVFQEPNYIGGILFRLTALNPI